MLGLCCRTRAFSGRSEEGMLSVWHAGVSFLWPLCLGNVGARCMGFRSLITWAQPLWWAGLVAPKHVESSRIRDQTRDKLVSPGRFLYTGQPGKLKKKKKGFILQIQTGGKINYILESRSWSSSVCFQAWKLSFPVSFPLSPLYLAGL